MQFFNAAGKKIDSLDDWLRLAPPAGAGQVAEGRSFVEPGRAWVEGDAVDRVTGLLEDHAGHGGVVIETGIVEKLTQFDDNPRGPRHHDLLATASFPAGMLVVGVEGKADETFGDPLDRHVRRAVDASPASGTPKRVDRLATTFFGSTLADDASLGGLHYQLLSALAGTLVDAREQGAVEAILLIHEFRTARTDDRLHTENAAALDAFLAHLHPTGERSGDETAWITDAVAVRGDGRWLPDEMPVRVAKLLTDSRAAE